MIAIIFVIIYGVNTEVIFDTTIIITSRETKNKIFWIDVFFIRIYKYICERCSGISNIRITI